MKKFLLLNTVGILLVLNCSSQAGSLDPSFGNRGKVYTNILDVNKADEFVQAVAIQTDGKIVVVGKTNSPTAILRYNTNGSLDNSFDGDGMTFYLGLKATSLAIQNDGKIIVAGAINNDGNLDFALVRFNANGSRDNSFDGDGKVTTAIGPSEDKVTSIAIQSDGKIIVAGYSYNGINNDFALVRYNNNGSLDNSFDEDGKLTVPIGIGAIAIQPDGKIVAAGSSYNGSNTDFALARYNQDGSPDYSFDSDGILTTDISSANENIRYVAIQSDGKIMTTGSGGNSDYTNFIFCRYNSNGNLDNTFDGDGKLMVSNSFLRQVNSMVIQSNGKIVVAGCEFVGRNFAVARFNNDGSMDNSFDGDGKLTTAFGSPYNQATCLIIQNDGKIIAGGKAEGNTSYDDFAIVRYNIDGSLDNSFDGDGRVTTNFPSSFDVPSSLAVQNDGKIIVAGWGGTTDLGHDNKIALVRYNTNGTLDNTFDGDGKVITQVGSNRDNLANAIAIQSDGKILVAGSTDLGGSSGYDFLLLRYNIDGSLDNSFDGDGIATTGISGTDFARCMTIQSDGKIVIAGSINGSNSADIVVIRFNMDGSLDNTFDSDGKFTLSLGVANIARSLAIQNDGRILVGGNFFNITSHDFFLLRFNTNGTLDNSFDGDGIVATDFGIAFYDLLSSIAIQSDGKIVAAGRGGLGFAIARYNPDGSLDNSFDGDGKLTTDLGSGGQMAIQANGKIIVAGEARASNGSTNIVLARYNTDGSPDNSFDGDGKTVFDLTESSSYEYVHAIKIYSNRIYLAAEMMTEGAVDFMLAAVFAEPPSAPSMLMVDFSGKLVNNDALLTWNTKNETNMLEFIVERSIDGRNFTPAGYTGAANTSGINHYNLTDFNVTSLNISVVYYRLKQKGLDGSFSYSRIVVLPIDKTLILFYPNPVINEANLVFTVNSPKRVLVRIIDNKGRIVRQEQLNLAAGSTSLSMDVTALARGIYYLTLRGESIDYTKKFVK